MLLDIAHVVPELLKRYLYEIVTSALCPALCLETVALSSAKIRALEVTYLTPTFYAWWDLTDKTVRE